jgi:hypothetical protein
MRNSHACILDEVHSFLSQQEEKMKIIIRGNLLREN